MRGAEFQDYYTIMGLPAAATAADIKARYRALSKLHHPDRGGNHADMAKINHAYTVLSDAFKRNIYDAERRRHLQAIQGRPTGTKAASPGTQSASTPRSRQSAPRARTAAIFTPHRRTQWWPKIIFTCASLVIVAGILLHLPVAEAIGPSDHTETAVKPLDITYPVDTASMTSPSETTPPAPSTPPEVQAPPDTAQTLAPASETLNPHDNKHHKIRELCKLISKSRVCTEPNPATEAE